MTQVESISAETIENLLAAYISERNSSARYVAYAVEADKEGYLGVGSLFRAVAHSEQVHATNHAKVLRKFGADLEVRAQEMRVRSTRENLSTAMHSEQDERDQMYPEYAEQAKADGCEAALRSFDSASDAEEEHALMFAAALDSMDDYRERTEYFVCMACGCLVTGRNFRRCVLCGAKRETFDKIE